jgi:hypothetical protein
MRVLPGYTIALLLAVLLIGTTPVGTGVGLHQFDLVHPLFSHVHLVNGRVVTHDQMQRGETTVARPGSPGPALGAANAPGLADGELGAFATDQPIQALDVLMMWHAGRTEWSALFPLDRREAPPDPPPTSSTSFV